MKRRIISISSDLLGFLGCGHILNWLITKGVIWIAYELFKVNWHNEFWAVYLLMLILWFLFGTKGA